MMKVLERMDSTGKSGCISLELGRLCSSGEIFGDEDIFGKWGNTGKTPSKIYL